jgi:hypothetical protein
MRTWLGLIRVATLWAPLAILLFWGGSFIWACAGYLANPGVPLRFAYRAPAGTILVLAESYVLDTNNGNLTVVKPRILEPNGNVLFYADRVDAKGLPLLNNQARRAVVTGRNAFATIVRRADGKFEFLNFLPKREGPPSDFPYSVTLNRGTVKYVEEGVSSRHSQNIILTDLKVDGTGERWVASALGDAEKVGQLQASVQNLPGEGVWIRGSSGGLEVAGLYEAFKDTRVAKQTPALEQISARSAKLRGPFELFIPTKSGAKLQTKLYADLKDFRYGKEYFAQTAFFDGNLNAEGAEGLLAATSPGVSLRYQGRTNWAGTFRMDGNLDGTSSSLQTLPKGLRFPLPKYVSVTGPLHYSGALTFDHSEGAGLSGDLVAKSITAYQESVAGPSASVNFHRGQLATRLKSGIWRGVPIAGRLTVDKNRRLDGSFSVQRVNLAGLASRFHIDRLGGTASANLLLDGTLDKPIAYVQGESQANFALARNSIRTPGQVKFAGTLNGDKLRIDQAYLVSNTGSISASGTYDLQNDRLKVSAVGSGIDLFKLDSGYEGIGRFKADVEGSLRNPHYKGNAEVFGLRLQDQPIPVITADIKGDFRSLTATNLRAVKGASQAEGTVSLDLRKNRINGTFAAKGVQMSDFLGDDYLASIDLTEARLGGTLSSPNFTANAAAKEILLQGTKLDTARAQITYKNQLVQVDNIEVRQQPHKNAAGESLPAGLLTGFLSYDVKKKAGQGDFNAQHLSMEDFLPKSIGATVAADFSGDAGLTFTNKGFKRGSGEGKLADIVVNGTDLGSGSWKLRADGTTVGGDVFFGGLSASVDLTGLSYNLKTEEIGGNVWLRNAKLEDIYKIATPYLPTMDFQTTALLNQTKGIAGFVADLGGTIKNPNLANAGLTVEAAKVGEREAGNLKSEFSRIDKKWDIKSFVWNGGPVDLEFKGNIAESGPINISGFANQIDISYLSLYDVSLAKWRGFVDIPLFTVEGNAKSPEIHASLASSAHTVDPAQAGIVTPTNGIQFGDSADFFNFNIANLSIIPSEKGNAKMDIDGSVNYHNYSASIEANLPFRYPFEVPGDQPLSALATFKQDLKSILAPQDPTLAVGGQFFDPDKSSGSLVGEIRVGGSKDQLTLTGQLALEAPTLAMRQGTTFKDVSIRSSFEDEVIRLNAKLASAEGGTLQASAQATLSPLEELVRRFREEGFATIGTAPLRGSVEADSFASKFKIGNDGSAGGVLGGSLALAGTIAEPAIKGDLTLDKGLIAMPSKIEENTSGLVPILFPKMDLTVATGSPVKFKSSSADIDMVGRGTIQGDFSNMDINGLLRVQKGVLRLPTARVNLQPGGTMRPNFSLRDGEMAARLDVELEGKTNVVAARFGQTAQRYDVTLDVRGDLLQDGGLTLNATSDPPDLSTDQILALLGQVQLIEGLAGGLQSGNAESHIREAVLGIAVPYLLDPVTSQIASSLRLDYLTLDINALDGATISFAKTIGKNLVFSGSRQVTQINHNYPLKYDLRLAYQFRFGKRGDRRRLNFIVGLDEIRPWKIAVEYGFRF